MKKTICLILAAVLLFSFAACSKEKNATEELTEITVCLDWTPNTNHTGFFVADKLGYYEDAGFKVSIVQPPENGAELMTASGQAQFGISFQDTLADLFSLEEVPEITAVAAVIQHNTSGIISRKGEGMTSPKGLEGKRYSTWDWPIEQAIVRYITEKDGGDYSKIELIPNVVTNEAEALRNGDTDAIWIYYAWAGVACEEAGLEFDYFSFTDIDKVFDLSERCSAFVGHGGGDHALVADFVKFVNDDNPSVSCTAIADSVAGHLVIFCADESMNNGAMPVKTEF
mgnify:CR=1 FL=1